MGDDLDDSDVNEDNPLGNDEDDSGMVIVKQDCTVKIPEINDQEVPQ